MQKSAEIQTGVLLEEATNSSTSPYIDADNFAELEESLQGHEGG